jgi:hypothetical protein
LVHGRATFAYLSGDEWPKDSNMTIEVLQRTLSAIAKAGEPLPRILYLQLDNTSRCGPRVPFTGL